jgi:hypothetical protein
MFCKLFFQIRKTLTLGGKRFQFQKQLVVYQKKKKKKKISKFSNPNIVEDLLISFFSFENDNKTNPPYDPHF